MKTILHLRSTFHAGGTENLLVRLFNEPNDSFRILLVLMKPGSLMNDLDNDKNKVIHLYRRKKADPIFLYKLVQLIKRERPWGIHSHQEIELLYALLLKFFFPKIKLFHHVHLLNLTNRFWLWFEKMVCNHFVYKVIAVSYTLESDLQRRGFRNNLNVIYNVVQISHKLNLIEKNNFLKKIHFKKSEFLIGMIGNFVEEKDQLTLAKAFLLVQSSAKNIKLIFIGKESEKIKACRAVFKPEEIEQSVFFLGQVNHASELIPFFSLMVFSSTQETFGMAALETLLYGIPLIASDIPVMKELSNNGQYFELFSMGNEVELAEKILKMMANRQMPEQRLKISKNYALESFNAQRFIAQMSGLYS